eukprot:m.83350 g.83350  ORF g.83350 m.83350 type:complete len:312 (+) comp8686_c0_seq24:685-1620(+)
MIAISALIVHNMLVLVSTKQYLSIKYTLRRIEYGEMAAVAFGRTGLYVTNIILSVTHLGYIWVYVIFIAKHLHEFTSYPYPVVAAWVIPVAALVAFIPSLKRLAPVAILSNLMLVFSSVVVFVYIFRHFLRPTPASPYCTLSSNDAQGVECLRSPFPVPYTSISALPLFFGNCLYSFEAMGLVLPMENAVKTPSLFPRVIILGMLLVTILFVLLGSFGYVVFGAALQGPVSLYLPINLKLYSTVKVFLCVTLLQSIAMQFFPVRVMFENLTQPWRSCNTHTSHGLYCQLDWIDWQHLFGVDSPSIVELVAC